MQKFLLAFVWLSLVMSLYGQDITYTNQSIQVVEKIEPYQDENTTAAKKMEVHGSWMSQFRYFNVTGNGSSLADQGFYHSHALNVSMDGEIGDNVFFKGNVAGSYDDQPTSSSDKFRLDNLLIDIYRPDVFSFQFGDAINPTVSYYTLQHSLEGFAGYYTFGDPHGQSVRFTGIFGQAQRDFRGPRRLVYGYRAEGREMAPGLNIGFDQIFISDSSDMPTKQDVSVLSLNGRCFLAFVSGLEFSWDLAHSFNINSRPDNEPDQQDGWAGQARLTYTPDDKGRFYAEYEEASYDFVSPVGNGAPDRRAVRLLGDYQVLINLTMRGGYTYDCNNLNHQLDSTTQTHQVNWDLDYHPFQNHPDEYLSRLMLEQNFSVIRRFNKNDMDSKIWDLFWELSDQWRGLIPKIGYGVSLLHDSISDDSDLRTHRVQGELRYTQDFADGAIFLDTRFYVRYTDELLIQDERVRNITRVYGWELKTRFYQHYQFASAIVYQRLTKPGDSREGELYQFKFDAHYIRALPLGQFQAGVVFEYNLYNYMLNAEQYDEFKVLGNLVYSF